MPPVSLSAETLSCLCWISDLQTEPYVVRSKLDPVTSASSTRSLIGNVRELSIHLSQLLTHTMGFGNMINWCQIVTLRRCHAYRHSFCLPLDPRLVRQASAHRLLLGLTFNRLQRSPSQKLRRHNAKCPFLSKPKTA